MQLTSYAMMMSVFKRTPFLSIRNAPTLASGAARPSSSRHRQQLQSLGGWAPHQLASLGKWPAAVAAFAWALQAVQSDSRLAALEILLTFIALSLAFAVYLPSDQRSFKQVASSKAGKLASRL